MGKILWYFDQKKIGKNILALVAFVLLVSVMANTVEAGVPSVEKIYKKKCAVCHGKQGDGSGRAGVSLTPPPTAFTALRAPNIPKRLAMIQVVAEGKKGTAMVGYQRVLSSQQIHAMVDYIREKFMSLSAHQIPTSTSSPPLTIGKSLYTKHCAACHGDKGNTARWAKNGLKPPPRNFTADTAKIDLSIERMLVSIKFGRPGTAMMPFQSRLNDGQVMAVISYIRETFMGLPTVSNRQEGVTPPSPLSSPQAVSSLSNDPDLAHSKVDFNLPFPKQLHGDSVAGEKFYRQNCFTCHGQLGDGKGPRSYFNRPPPRDFTSETSRQIYNRPRLFAAISQGKRGSVMSAWSTVLSAQEIANVAEFVLQQFILGQTDLGKKKR